MPLSPASQLRVLPQLPPGDPYLSAASATLPGVAWLPADEAALADCDVVVTRYAPGLFTRLQRHRRGILVVFVGEELQDEELLEASRGAPFEHFRERGELEAFLTTLARPRVRAPRRGARNLRLILPATDASEFPGNYAVAEISSAEVSFFVEPGDDMERFLVGAILEPVTVVTAHEGAEAVVDLSLQVRTVYLDEGRYRITASFGRPRGPLAPPPWQRQVTGWRAIALLRGALERGESFTIREDRGFGDGAAIASAAPQIDVGPQGITVRGRLPVAPLDPVVVTFRFRECLSRFATVVAARTDTETALRLPATLEEVDARRTVRHDTARLTGCTAALVSPLFPERVEGAVVDVGATGFRVRYTPPAGLPLPTGTVFDRVELVVDGTPLRGRAVLRNVAAEDDVEGTLLGFSFEPDRPSAAALPALFARLEVPGIVDGSAVSFEELLTLFRGSSFLSTEMEEDLAPLFPVAGATHEALRGAPPDVFRAAAFREGEEILAYISLVRAYRRTLAMQHHAALPGRGFGRRVQSGILQYVEGQADYEYIRAFFFVGNAFPESRFGDFARKEHDPEAVDLRVFSHVLVPRAAKGTLAQNVPVDEADDSDLARIERHVLATERGLLVRSEDLAARWIRLEPLDARFGTVGLYRRRRVFVARRGGALVGAALLEWSSPGINLFEGFSTFRLLPLDGDHLEDDVASALVARMHEIALADGRPFLFGLVPPELVARAETLARFSSHRSWSFTVRRDHLRQFARHLLGP